MKERDEESLQGGSPAGFLLILRSFMKKIVSVLLAIYIYKRTSENGNIFLKEKGGTDPGTKER